MVGGFAYSFDGALNELQDAGIGDLAKMGNRDFSRHWFRCCESFGLKGKCRLHFVFGAQEASKSVKIGFIQPSRAIVNNTAKTVINLMLIRASIQWNTLESKGKTVLAMVRAADEHALGVVNHNGLAAA